MFEGSSSFNQPLTKWNLTSSVVPTSLTVRLIPFIYIHMIPFFCRECLRIQLHLIVLYSNSILLWLEQRVWRACLKVFFISIRYWVDGILIEWIVLRPCSKMLLTLAILSKNRLLQQPLAQAPPHHSTICWMAQRNSSKIYVVRNTIVFVRVIVFSINMFSGTKCPLETPTSTDDYVTANTLCCDCACTGTKNNCSW